MIRDRLEDEADFMDALYEVDHMGVALVDDTDELHDIFAGAGFSGETGLDAAMRNDCMLTAGFVMGKQDETTDDYEGY